VAGAFAVLAAVSGCNDELKPGIGEPDAKDRKKPSSSASPRLRVLGNGISEMPARTISDKAEAELKAADSVRVRVDTRTEDGRLKVELRINESDDCTGTFGAAGGGKVDIVRIGDEVWMKPDAAYWKTQLPGPSGERAAALFSGRYLYGRSQDDKMLSGTAEMCDLKEITETGEKGMEDPDLSKGGTGTVEGTPVIDIISKKDEETTTVSVATKGKPYPLKIVMVGGDSPGTLYYSEFGKPVEPEKPSAEDSVDIKKFREQVGGGGDGGTPEETPTAPPDAA
jgi:hypothetical protein